MRLFHVTNEDWGNEIILHPRVSKRFKWLGEPETPRICVAETPEQAWFAAGSDSFPTRIYECYSDYSILAKNVKDSCVTGERWILESTKFKLIGEIIPFEFNDSPKNFKFIKEQMSKCVKYSNIKK